MKAMKLSQETLKKLENFATVNDRILIPATKSGSNKTLVQIGDKHRLVVAQTTVPEVFDKDVCIGNLSAFLSTVTAMNSPEITLSENKMTLQDNDTSVSVTYGTPTEALQELVKKRIEFANPVVSFTLKEETLKKINNLSSIWDLPDLRLFSKEDKLFIQSLNRENKSTNSGAIQVGEGSMDADVFFPKESMKMLASDYTVDVYEHAARFKSAKHDDLEYLVLLAN